MIRTTLQTFMLSTLATISSYGGGIEKPIEMTGFNIGAGAQYQQQAVYFSGYTNGTAALNNFRIENQESISLRLVPLLSGGFTYEINNYVVGAYLSYTYPRSQTTIVTIGTNYPYNISSIANAKIFFGIKANESNVAYVGGGWTGMWASQHGYSIRNFPQANGGSAARSFQLNGGVFGVGFRHYFDNNIYTDFSADYAIYANGPAGNLEIRHLAALAGTTNSILSGFQNPWTFTVSGEIDYLFTI